MKETLDKLLLTYDRLIEILEQLSMNAKDQKEKLKGTVVADELASDYSDIAMLYVKLLFENEWISKEQFLLAQDIDNKLEQMSQEKSLWNENALSNAMEWEDCRIKAKKLLETLKKSK